LPKKTKFEQVPLEIVKKVIEEEAEWEKMSGSGPGTKKDDLEQIHLAIRRANGKGAKA
jgi:hypothetical protein